MDDKEFQVFDFAEEEQEDQKNQNRVVSHTPPGKQAPKKTHAFSHGIVVGVIIGLVISLMIGIVCIFAVGGSGLGNLPQSAESGDDAEKAEQAASKLAYLKKLINSYFLWDTDEDQMIEGLYKGLFESLGDPYSVYYTEEEFKALMEETSGMYCGIGVQVSQDADTNVIVVTRVFDGSPAQEAGIEIEDIITSIDGTDVTAMSLDDTVDLIKGEADTSVAVTLLRGNESLTLNVTRREIEVPTVESQILNETIGYVIVSSFDSVTNSQFRKAVEDLRSQGISKVIIDLRYNGGGYLDVVLDMLDYLLPEGLLVYTEDRYGEREEYRSSADESWDDVEMVILTNEYTASASEIFSGAMRDYGVAKLVGTNTYGKGIVQDVLPLSDGSGVKITVSEYFTPSGFALHKVGLAPDVEVELAEDAVVYDPESDNQLQEAIRLLEKE